MGPYGPKTTKADVKELSSFMWHWLRIQKWIYITAVKTSEQKKENLQQHKIFPVSWIGN